MLKTVGLVFADEEPKGTAAEPLAAPEPEAPAEKKPRKGEAK